MRGVAGRAGAFLCPHSLLPCLLDEAAINITVDDSMKVDASPLPSADNIDRFEFFPCFLVKPGKFSLEATKVSPDFRRRLAKRLRRIGKPHPVITRLEILLEEKQTLLLCALILPSSHLLLSRLFADAFLIPLSVPARDRFLHDDNLPAWDAPLGADVGSLPPPSSSHSSFP